MWTPQGSTQWLWFYLWSFQRYLICHMCDPPYICLHGAALESRLFEDPRLTPNNLPYPPTPKWPLSTPRRSPDSGHSQDTTVHYVLLCTCYYGGLPLLSTGYYGGHTLFYLHPPDQLNLWTLLHTNWGQTEIATSIFYSSSWPSSVRISVCNALDVLTFKLSCFFIDMCPVIENYLPIRGTSWRFHRSYHIIIFVFSN